MHCDWQPKYCTLQYRLLLQCQSVMMPKQPQMLTAVPSSNETLLLIIVISSGLPQLVLLLSVTYRQLKGKQIAKYISRKVHNVIKQICT